MGFLRGGHLPMLLETVYAAVSGYVGVSSIPFWPAFCSRGRIVAHSRLATLEVIMPVSLQISLRIPGTAPIQEITHLVQEVEAAGFAGAGLLDSQLLCRDVFVTMAAAAMQTLHMTIFPAVTNPFTRHASVL